MKQTITNQKDFIPPFEEFSINKYRNLLDKLESLKYIESLLPDHKRSLRNFHHFISKLQVPEKILFIIQKETINNKTVYKQMIEEQLYILNTFNHSIDSEEDDKKEIKKPKKNSNGSYGNPITELEKEGLIEINRKCPHCHYNYGSPRQRLPELCIECDQPIFLQKVHFKKKSNRPYYTLKLTEEGEKHLKELIDSIFHACYFCIEWVKFLNKQS